jgi:hypothetical protein
LTVFFQEESSLRQALETRVKKMGADSAGNEALVPTIDTTKTVGRRTSRMLKALLTSGQDQSPRIQEATGEAPLLNSCQNLVMG